MFFHTHAPATDRYLARGLSNSVCVYKRKNRKIYLSRAKSGKTLVGAAAKWRKTNRTIWLLLSSETVFHRIGHLFHRIGPHVSQRRTFSKTNAPNLKKHPVYEPPRSPRKVAVKPAWHEGRKDTASVEDRASNVHSSKHEETCCGEIDYRIQGLPHSTVEQDDHTRKEVVNKLIHQFETHQDREALKADLKQNQANNPSANNRRI